MKASHPQEVINVRQLAVLIVFVVIGDSVLIVPSLVAYAAGQDAWLSGFLGVLLGLPIVLLLLALYARHPRHDLIQMLGLQFGRWAGGFISLLYLIYFLLGVSGLIRELGDFMTIQIIPETPLRAVHLLMLLLLLFAAKSGLEPLARTAELFFPFFALLFACMIAFLLPRADSAQLLPLASAGLSPIVHGSLYIVVYPFAELIGLTMIFPHVAATRHLKRDALIAAAIGGAAIAVIVAISILVLGAYLTASDVYPTYALAKKINIGSFLQRVEAILAFVWVLSTFFKASLFHYALVRGTSRLFGLPDYRVLLLPFTLLLFGAAYLISPNVTYYNDFLFKYCPFYDLTFAVALPLALLAVSRFRRQAGR